MTVVALKNGMRIRRQRGQEMMEWESVRKNERESEKKYVFVKERGREVMRPAIFQLPINK